MHMEEGRIMSVSTRCAGRQRTYIGKLVPLHNLDSILSYELSAEAVRTIGIPPRERRLVKYKKVAEDKAHVIDILR